MENNHAPSSSGCSDRATALTPPHGWRVSHEDRSIWFVSEKVAGLKQALGSGDRLKLTEYLDAVDVERRIQTAGRRTRELPVVDQPMGIPDTFEAHAKLMPICWRWLIMRSDPSCHLHDWQRGQRPPILKSACRMGITRVRITRTTR
jgi:hypothetical protein